MIKMKKFFLCAGIFFILLSSSSFQGLASTTGAMYDKLGEDFSNDFGLVVDFNAGGNPSSTGLATNIQVLQDLGNSSNPVVNPVDTNPWYDQQFFFSHFNVSGVDNIYYAMNKMEFNVTLTIPGISKTINFGHVNGSAPFQTLLQFYKYFGQDVLVANTFRGLIAYSTTAENGTITPTAQSYFGYSFVETHLIDLLNNALTSHNFSAIPQYNYEPIYYPANHTFGMIYKNYFVVWQNATPSTPSALKNYSGNQFDNVVTGGNMAGASLFDYLKFTYQVVEDTAHSNDTYKKVNVIANYDLGPMKWLITRDSSATYSAIQTASSSIDASNSFFMGSAPWSVVVKTSSTLIPDIQVNVNVPDLTFYTGSAVLQRLNAQAVKDTGASGMGIAIATSTNAIIQGQTLTTPNSVTDDQDTNIPLTYGSTTFYSTNFVGKSTYTRTFDNGSKQTNLPVYISLRPLSEISTLLNTHALLVPYFNLQWIQTIGISLFSARQLDPATFTDSTTASDIGLTPDNTLYITLVQMPKWSGLQVTQDPTFSAVAAVAGQTSSSSNASVNTGIPGFEMYVAIAALIPLFMYKKKHSKK